MFILPLTQNLPGGRKKMFLSKAPLLVCSMLTGGTAWKTVDLLGTVGAF